MKFSVAFSNGRELEVDRQTYEELTKRIGNGRHNGWYTIKHGPSMGSSFNFTTVGSVEVIMTEKERKEVERKQEEEYKAKITKIENETVSTTGRMEGSFSYTPEVCPVNHNSVGKDTNPNIEPRKLLTERGTTQYFPVCTMCGWRGQLVKPASIENTFGIKVEDVKDYEG